MTDVKTLQRRLLDEIDPYYPMMGGRVKLRRIIRDAFMACPRHRFLQRFRFDRRGPIEEITAKTRSRLLPRIYTNAWQVYVDHRGNNLPATNSEPGFILSLLEALGIGRGQRVLELGSGGGWLSAVIGQAVGPRGHVVGMEVIPELAEQSRRSLRSLGLRIDLGNVRIVTGDGNMGFAEVGPYHRVTITAGSRVFPGMLFEQVVDGGRVCIPLSNRAGWEEVFVLQREGNSFRSLSGQPAFFVPLVGSGMDEEFNDVVLERLPLWQRVKGQLCSEQTFWLGGEGDNDLMQRSQRFRSFLAKVEPAYRLIKSPQKPGKRAPDQGCFGVIDEHSGSIALCQGHHLRGFGNTRAVTKLVNAYSLWVKEFMPLGTSFGLQIFLAGQAPKACKRQWLEHRGGCDFLWTLPPREQWSKS